MLWEGLTARAGRIDVVGRLMLREGLTLQVDVEELHPEATCRLLALNPKHQTPYAEV